MSGEPVGKSRGEEHRCEEASECAVCIAANPEPGDVLTPTERALANRYARIYPWLGAR